MSTLCPTCGGVLYPSTVTLLHSVGLLIDRSIDGEELLLFQNHMQSLICNVLKECEVGKNTAAVDSTNRIITGHIKF